MRRDYFKQHGPVQSGNLWLVPDIITTALIRTQNNRQFISISWHMKFSPELQQITNTIWKNCPSIMIMVARWPSRQGAVHLITAIGNFILGCVGLSLHWKLIFMQLYLWSSYKKCICVDWVLWNWGTLNLYFELVIHKAKSEDTEAMASMALVQFEPWLYRKFRKKSFYNSIILIEAKGGIVHQVNLYFELVIHIWTFTELSFKV